MTREEKKNKRIQRAIKRRARRKEIYVKKIRTIREFTSNKFIPLSVVSKDGNYVEKSWYDKNSPTGYSQKCSYYGICQSPCNGDC